MVDSDDQRDFRRMYIDCPVSFRRLGADAFLAGCTITDILD